MKTKLYINTIEQNDFTYKLSFIGSDEIGKSNPGETNVLLICKNSSQIIWESNFGNQKMPDGAWNGFQNLIIFFNYLFCGIDNKIYKLDPNTGSIINELSYGNTPIHYLKIFNDLIISENVYYQFDIMKYTSNVIALDVDLKIKWKAQIPMKNDIYCNPPIVQNNELLLNSWNCFQCKINKENGSITNRILTK